MSDYSFIRTTPFILRGEQHDLEQVPDEIFLDMQEAVDTQFLSVVCYEQAVLDCISMGDSCFLLRLRPDMRGLFISQLKSDCRVYRVYRYQSKPDIRVILTGELSVKFASGASLEDRRSSLQKCCKGITDNHEAKDGSYKLRLARCEDPLSSSRVLGLEGVVKEASPKVYVLPGRALSMG